jgi:lipoprotein NlpD
MPISAVDVQGSACLRGRPSPASARAASAKPTLHFELRRDNVPRDPAPYLPVRL